MRCLFIILCIFFQTQSPLYSQISTFEKAIGGSKGESGEAVKTVSDDGFILIGYSNSFSSRTQFYAVKTNFRGDIIWAKTYGESSGDYAYSVTETYDRGFVFFGYNNMKAKAALYLVRTDFMGNLLWSKNFYKKDNTETGRGLIETSEGDLVLVGESSDPTYQRDIYLVKTDRYGNVILDKTYGGTDEDTALGVIEVSTGGYLISGWSKSFGNGDTDGYLVRTNSDGEVLWTKVLGGSDEDMCLGLAETIDGKLIVAGFSRSFGAGQREMYLVKLDLSGNIIWSRTYGENNFDVWGGAVKQDKEGNYYLLGSTSNNNHDLLLIKTDSLGEELWRKTFGGAGYDIGYSLDLTHDNGIVMLGETSSFGRSKKDMYFLKTDKDGMIHSEIEISKNANPPGVFPNPFSDQITIKLQDNLLEYDIVITDLQGRKVTEVNNVKEVVTITTQDFQSGIYIISVLGNNRTPVTKKLILKQNSTTIR